MDKKVNEKKKKYAIVITFLVLMICITGGTYAYFALTASNNSVTGSVGGASLNLEVTKVYPTSEHNNKNMIPQLESTLDEAISLDHKCVDGNGNVICQVYSATVTNVGSTSSVLNGTISFTGIENMPNLKWMRINDSNTLGTYSSFNASTDKALFEEERSFGANTSNTYYFVFWIDETGEVQTDNGTFRANIEFDSSTGGLTSTVRPSNPLLSDYIISLYNDGSSITNTTVGDGPQTVNLNNVQRIMMVDQGSTYGVEYRYYGNDTEEDTANGKYTLQAKAIGNNRNVPDEKEVATLGTVNSTLTKIKDIRINNIRVSENVIVNEGDEVKIFIIDECHALSSQAWQAFLKCIEEPPQYTIFMFCTTNPEKIPDTILNRVMRFNLSRVDTNLIRQRLEYICEKEHFINYIEACDFIAKLSNGGVRDAIATLEKCANYDTDLNIQNVLDCLGTFSFEALFNLTAALYAGDEGEVLNFINSYYNSGNDLKQFIEQYLEFTIDLTKFVIFKDMSMIKIPASLESRCNGYANVPGILQYSNSLVEYILSIKNAIKYDVNSKTTVEAMLIAKCQEAME